MAGDVQKKWLIDEAWEEIDPVWQDRIVVILEDLLSMPHLISCQAFTDQGTALSHLLHGDGNIGNASDGIFEDVGALANTANRLFSVMGEELPSHMVERTESAIHFIGFAAGLILIASFSKQAMEGTIAMRFAKRIRHLRSLQRTRDRGALYV